MLQTIRALLACVLLAVLAAPVAAEDRASAAAATTSALPLATPESQGMSRVRLDRMHAEMRRFVDEGLHSGVVTLVARNGKLVDLYSYGKRDLEAGLPMQPDTIFRIYSMSKIVTSVAALVLLEDARFRLSDPVGDYLPELAHMKVMTGGTAEKPLLADAQKPITIKDLFTHSSGLIYGFGNAPIDKIYKDAEGRGLHLARGLRHARLAAAARPRARDPLQLRAVDRRAGCARREALRPDARGVLRGADLPAAAHDATPASRCPRRNAAASRRSTRRERTGSWLPPSCGSRSGRSRGRSSRRAAPACSRRSPTTLASCRCCSTAASSRARACSRARRSS